MFQSSYLSSASVAVSAGGRGRGGATGATGAAGASGAGGVLQGGLSVEPDPTIQVEIG